MIYDVRDTSEVDQIVFSEKANNSGQVIAHRLEKRLRKVGIVDGPAFVLVEDIGHAKNLIKALEKAIDLGWLK
jgi:adenosine/AMP kinase